MLFEFAENTPDNYQILFVELIIPLPVPKIYTYRVPNEWNDVIGIGTRVVVQFGAKKIYTALVVGVSENPPVGYQAKYILDVLDETPLLNQKQVNFIHWMSDYYLAHPGEVLTAALPAGLKLSSESSIQLKPEYELEEDLNIEEISLIQLLKTKEYISFSDAEKTLKIKGFNKLIAKLIKRDAILIFEQVKDKYTPKIVKKIRLHPAYLDEKSLESLFGELAKFEKQQEIILHYLSESNCIAVPELNEVGIAKSSFAEKELSVSAINTLIKKGVIEEFSQQISRFQVDRYTEDKKTLNPLQEIALKEIKESFEDHNVTLLHGITGSGKTEVYIHLIEEMLLQGKQVLYLLPEIALSTQIFSRLRKIFGSILGVYHSKFSDNERVEIYKGLKNGELQLILGVRSSIFLPFDNLGLIIIDEEHDPSYKQHDPAPRYSGRDASLYLAHIHQAKVLLGTATPSIESYYLAKEGKYGFVKMTQRHGKATLPEIILAPSPFIKDGVNYFSDAFIKLTTDILEKNEQSIVFQNRRGYAPYLQCSSCSYIPHCVNCNVSLTLHKGSGEIKCHYCGHHQGVPTNCPECGARGIYSVGMGTEKLEDDMQVLFKTAKISRLDTDTARSKNKLEEIFNDFKSRKTNVLIGTQMVTKGLDFDNVTLVTVFDIDRMLFFPDFRASERVVQVLTQISGRAGRANKSGKVLINTNNPEHVLIQQVIKDDYEGFYEKEIVYRRQFLYPPFCRLIKILIKNEDKAKVERCSLYLGRILKEKFGTKAIVGPEEPIVNRVRNQFLEQIYFKLPRNQKFTKDVKLYILEIIEHTLTKADYKNCRITVDVDPV
jgi:primosomal protein N' (replication factor Y) (superfamily II helicase)